MIRSALVVDDDPSDRLVASRVIRRVAPTAKTYEFTNGQEALDFIENTEGLTDSCGPFPPPVLVLVDINMPVMDGFELLDRIDALIVDGRIPEYWLSITVFTSSSNPADRERAAGIACVRDYIVKPLTAAHLDEHLRKHFLSNRGGEPLA